MAIKDFIRLNKTNIKLLVELGAHFGTDTLEFRTILPEARIIVFEPDPRNIAIIENKFKVNNIELQKFAVADFNGQLSFIYLLDNFL